MPIFEVQTDAGTFQIDAPDQNSALQALSQIPTAPGDSLAGSTKALGTGLAEGVIGLAGLPADAVDLATRGIDAVAGTKSNEAVSGLKKLGSDSIKKTIESYTGEFAKPQTGLEKTLHTVASFGPAALAGPGGIARRVATNVVAPGLASEAAGQLAEGTGYEPAARVAGALTGAVGASRAAAAAAAPRAAAVPAREEIANAVTAGYNHPAVRALEINPTYAGTIANNITTNLRRGRFSDRDPGTATVYGLVDDLRRPEFGANHTLADFDNVRRRLNEVAGTGGQAGQAAQRAIRSIDAATLRIPQSAVIAGDARAASQALHEARRNAAAGFRSDRVREALERAANTATATHSGGNLENEIYKQVRTMLNNPRQHLRGWNAEEIQALRDVLPGRGARALRRAGKVLGGGGGLGQLAAGSAGAGLFGVPGMLALPALGLGANRLGSALAERRLGNVDELLRSRTPLYGPANQAQRQQLLLNGGILQGLPPPRQLALSGLLAASSQRPY